MLTRRVALSGGSPERLKSVEGTIGVCHWLCQFLVGYGRWWWIDGARRGFAAGGQTLAARRVAEQLSP